jgi:predicted TIM-barrel fold metal-dependent hydrolase
MTQVEHLTAREIRRRLGHPVIDADGHFLELMPLVEDDILAHLEETGGKELRERYRTRSLRYLDTVSFEADRRSASVVESWRAMPSWWGNPVADARERATAHLPGLLYERLDELGVDVMLTYPSWTLGFLSATDGSLRAPVCRAVNRHTARVFAPYLDRLLPAALVPMETPEEAVAEIDYAVGELGFKLVVLAGHATRPVGASGDPAAFRLDVFGIDSAFDYDPVWEACVRNRVAPVFHSSVQSSHPARSISNYAFNHIGGIAHAHEALCKALFMGGVYRRFPQLRFGYLEGGVMWGASLLADMVGHWEKRGAHAIHELDPSRLDVEAVMQLVRSYGTEDMLACAGSIERHLSRQPARLAELDDFAAAGIESAEDIVLPFTERSFFGCEADDPLIPLAFRARVAHVQAVLRPILGTDVSHWDAPVMNEVLCEAYEAVEEGWLTEAQFGAFTFSNAVQLHGGVNPSFFAGTVCEHEAAAVLGVPSLPTAR